MNMKKAITLAMSLLLVGSNVAFSQTKTPSKSALKNNVQRATAAESAKRKGPTSQQLMKEIKETLTPSNRRKIKYLNPRTFAIAGGIIASGGLIAYSASVFVPAAHAAGFSALEFGVGMSVTAGAEEMLLGTGILTTTGAFAMATDDEMPLLPHQTEKYRKIQNALNSEFLGHFTVILVWPDKISERTQDMLVEFLKHPYKNYSAEKLNGEEYRFLFDPYNPQIWVDIDVRNLTLIVRQSVIMDPNDKIPGVIIQGHYAGKPLQKGEKYK